MTTYDAPPPSDDLFMDEDSHAGPVQDTAWHDEAATIRERAARLGRPQQPAAPPPDLEGAILYLGRAIGKLAESLTSAPSAPPGAAVAPPPVQPPTQGYGPPPAAKGPNTTGMGKKVYAICRAKNTTPQAVGTQVLGRDPGVNSQQWTAADLNAVLDAMTAWGWNNR